MNIVELRMNEVNNVAGGINPLFAAGVGICFAGAVACVHNMVHDNATWDVALSGVIGAGVTVFMATLGAGATAAVKLKKASKSFAGHPGVSTRYALYTAVATIVSTVCSVLLANYIGNNIN